MEALQSQCFYFFGKSKTAEDFVRFVAYCKNMTYGIYHAFLRTKRDAYSSLL